MLHTGPDSRVVAQGCRGRRCGHPQELSTAAELLGAVPMAEETVVAHAMEAPGQYVEEHASDELRGRERHRCLSLAVPVIGVAEAGLSCVDIQQPVVGDGEAVGIAADVIHDLRGATEGRLGVDDPVALPYGLEVIGKALRVGQRLERPEETQLPVVNASNSASRNNRRNSRDSTRTGRKDPRRQVTQRVPSRERPPPGSTPCRCGWCTSVCPHVWSTAKKPICAPRCLGSAAMLRHVFGGRPKEAAIDDSFVVGGDLGNRPGQGEDDVEVLDVEQVRLANLNPCRPGERLALVAVPIAAGVIPDGPMDHLLDAGTDLRTSSGTPGTCESPRGPTRRGIGRSGEHTGRRSRCTPAVYAARAAAPACLRACAGEGLSWNAPMRKAPGGFQAVARSV